MADQEENSRHPFKAASKPTDRVEDLARGYQNKGPKIRITNEPVVLGQINVPDFEITVDGKPPPSPKR